jgi:hypothetical protein
MTCTHCDLRKGAIELHSDPNPRPALPYSPYVQRIRQIGSAS